MAFEKSHVEAEITSPVISIKNPYSGKIIVPEVGEIIRDDEHALAEIICTGHHNKPNSFKTSCFTEPVCGENSTRTATTL